MAPATTSPAPCADCAPSEGPVKHINGSNGVDKTHVGIANSVASKGVETQAEAPPTRFAMPFMNRDSNSNVANFKIIES
jgi:hypothetical protein